MAEITASAVKSLREKTGAGMIDCKNALVEADGDEAQAVEMKFFDPIARVADEELAHRPGIRAVEIDRRAPIGFVAAGEIIIGENGEIVSIRAEVIVNDVENDADA